MMNRKWRIATNDEILEGKTTDVYFNRTLQVLESEGQNPVVHAEVTVSSMPRDLPWGILAGVDDALKLFEGKDVDIFGLPEGTLFYPKSPRGVRVPVFVIEGPYQEFVVLETPMLGFLCHTTGMASNTAHIRLACGNKTLLSFGARRTHPAITPQVEYAAYIGGCDGVSCVLGANLLELQPSGTMPHALIISFQDHARAWQAFDKHLEEDIPRVALTDTYLDEVREAILAAQSVPNLDGVRLDTPSSRKGDFKSLIQEVRWELEARGYNNIKIFVSGGLDVEKIIAIRDAGVDGYGVGGAISNAPAVDFAMDIVSIQENGEWKPCAKRGKFSGRKSVWQCPCCLHMEVTFLDDSAPKCEACKEEMTKAATHLMKKGKILQVPKAPKALRRNVLHQIEQVSEQ